MSVFSPDSLINQRFRMCRNPERPNFYYFVPENKVLSFMQMNSQSADPHGSLGRFLYQPGIQQPGQKERHEPNQMLPTEKSGGRAIR